MKARKDRTDEQNARRKEYEKQWRREWVKKNPERAKATYKKWYDANVEHARKKARDWYRNNRDVALPRAKIRNLLRAYGLTLEQYKALGDRCEICGQDYHDKRMRNGKPFRLAVDHDHDTKRVRGLLCGACNCGIGYFKDDVALMEKAIAYVKRVRQEI